MAKQSNKRKADICPQIRQEQRLGLYSKKARQDPSLPSRKKPMTAYQRFVAAQLQNT